MENEPKNITNITKEIQSLDDRAMLAEAKISCRTGSSPLRLVEDAIDRSYLEGFRRALSLTKSIVAGNFKDDRILFPSGAILRFVVSGDVVEMPDRDFRISYESRTSCHPEE